MLRNKQLNHSCIQIPKINHSLKNNDDNSFNFQLIIQLYFITKRFTESWSENYLPKPSLLEFNLNSILELVGEICWAAKELNIVAFWVILSFTNGTARPCSFTKEQFASMNSPCPLKVKDNPSNVSRWGSPMPAAMKN